MLLIFKDDYTTGSLYLHPLFYVLSMIICDFIYTEVHLHASGICTDGMIMNMCLCLILVAICLISHWTSILYY